METEISPQSRKIKLHSAQEIPRLLEEIIIEEILPKLPVKSLLRFRCVSKPWCSLISSKRFMKLHLRNSIKSSSLAHHKILFYTIEGFEHCSLPSLFDEPFTDAVTYNGDSGMNSDRDVVYLVGCCNGLVCLLKNRRSFILWNPTTKKSNHLPDFEDETIDGIITNYGFGFDELNDDYMVFGVLSAFNRSELPISKVYSLRSDSWEIIKGMDASPYEKDGTYVNGKLHWDDDKCGIVSFDLNSKVYGVVELPNYLKNCRLGVLRECLSVHCFLKGRVDIWVMKEYGVKESWNKVATVPYYRSPRVRSLPCPFTIGPNGEVLLSYGVGILSALLLYNPKGNVFRHPRMTDNAELIFRDVGIYVESLASVVHDAQQEN